MPVSIADVLCLHYLRTVCVCRQSKVLQIVIHKFAVVPRDDSRHYLRDACATRWLMIGWLIRASYIAHTQSRLTKLILGYCFRAWSIVSMWHCM